MPDNTRLAVKLLLLGCAVVVVIHDPNRLPDLIFALLSCNFNSPMK
jgi:hypothetical protein